MKVLIVYDSYFGNTEKLAQALMAHLAREHDVVLLKAGNSTVKDLEGIDHLIVGSPTRAFQPSDNVKKFLKDIPKGALKGVSVHAFDTRMALDDVSNGFLRFMAKVFGYAGEKVLKNLVKKGGYSTLPASFYYVADMEGPLKKEEVERIIEDLGDTGQV